MRSQLRKKGRKKGGASSLSTLSYPGGLMMPTLTGEGHLLYCVHRFQGSSHLKHPHRHAQKQCLTGHAVVIKLTHDAN